MWTPLEEPGVWRKVLDSCRTEEAPVLALAIAYASSSPWADLLSVVTSLGNLYLTTRRTYDATTAAWTIHLSVVENFMVHLAYVPPGADRSVAHLIRRPELAFGGIELFMLRMTYDYDALDSLSSTEDNSQERSLLAIGDRVTVGVDARNRTRHQGTITRAVWHHQQQRWLYWLLEGGRNVKKRYNYEDLALQAKAAQQTDED